MARVARIALDITLYSIRTARPLISRTWDAAKTSISTTRLSCIVNNAVVLKAESLLGSATTAVETSLTSFRDSQLPGELKYLENELKKVKERLAKVGKS